MYSSEELDRSIRNCVRYVKFGLPAPTGIGEEWDGIAFYLDSVIESIVVDMEKGICDRESDSVKARLHEVLMKHDEGYREIVRERNEKA